MGQGTFGDGIDRLRDSVGGGKLVGTVEVNQVYAHYQHAHPEFAHPDGGKAFYLRDPLFAGAGDYLEQLATSAWDESGHSELNEAMIANMEDLSLQVFVEAPVEFNDLRRSGHPVVTDDGAVVYDRAPEVGRLSKDDLKLKTRIRNIVDPHRYRGSW